MADDKTYKDDDWFVPTKDQLDQMYNRTVAAGGPQKEDESAESYAQRMANADPTMTQEEVDAVIEVTKRINQRGELAGRQFDAFKGPGGVS